MNRPHCFQYLGGSRWRSVQAVNLFLSREDSMVNSGYAGALRLRGFELFDKVVQSRPRIWLLHKVLAHQEALESGRTELPHGAGIGKAALGDFNETLRNAPAQFERACRIGAERAQVAVVVPATSTSSQRCPSSCSLWISSSTSSPSECAYPASDPDVGRGQCLLRSGRTTSAPAIRASQIWYGSMIKSLRRIGIDRFLRAGIRSSRQPAK